MNLRSTTLATAVLLFTTASILSAAEPPKPPAEQVDMAEMMARMKKFTATGPEHEWLQRFLGEWDTETRITGMSGPETKPEKGTARGRWLIDGRWLALEGEGVMMGRPLKYFYLFGYDPFKMSYMTASVHSMDNSLVTTEGDLDPKTGSLLTYGTLDEYLTGEHDKMVKAVWRFKDANTMTFELHDLPIGETNTLVVEVTYRRRAGSAK